MDLKTLIDRARENVVGGKPKLADSLGVSVKRLDDWRYAVRSMPLEKQVLLCELAKLTDGECIEHLREQSGIAPKPTATHTGYRLAGALLTVGAGVLLALARGDFAAMYRPSTRAAAT